MGRVIVLLLLISLAFAWDGATHETIGNELGEHLDCDLVYASTVPDRVFHDTIRHHYYDTNWDCPLGEWVCPEEDDFIAMEMALEWNKTDCYSIGVASHYFFDSKVFWHKVQKENPNHHSYWETRVGEEYGRDFEYCRYRVCVDWDDFEQWKMEFNEFLGNPVECLSDKECEYECVKGKCVSFWENIIRMFLEIISYGR